MSTFTLATFMFMILCNVVNLGFALDTVSSKTICNNTYTFLCCVVRTRVTSCLEWYQLCFICIFKVAAPAKAGALAPIDVYLEAQNTGMGPEKTSFFQALSIPTKISRGTIEILVSSMFSALC